MTLEKVKNDLREVSIFYRNIDVLKYFPAKAELVEKYNTAIAMAPSLLISVYVYHFQNGMEVFEIADKLCLSTSVIYRLLNQLYNFFLETFNRR